MSKYCNRRREIIKFPMTEDYCVDCEISDYGECWANDLEVKYIDDETKIIQVDFRGGGVIVFKSSYEM